MFVPKITHSTQIWKFGICCIGNMVQKKKFHSLEVFENQIFIKPINNTGLDLMACDLYFTILVEIFTNVENTYFTKHFG